MTHPSPQMVHALGKPGEGAGRGVGLTPDGARQVYGVAAAPTGHSCRACSLRVTRHLKE